MASAICYQPFARDLQINVTLLTLVTLLGKLRADGHVIRSNITCLITLLSQGTLLDTSDVTCSHRQMATLLEVTPTLLQVKYAIALKMR